MSEIKVNSIKGVGASAAAITVNNTDGTCTANITNNLSNKNIIINGSMIVDQRSNGSSADTTGVSYISCDRFGAAYAAASKFTMQQVASTLAGFEKALKITSSGTTSNSGQHYLMRYSIEGHDSARLALGTSSAKTFTLSFYVKGSIAGDYSVAFANGSDNRVYATTYTIASTNTWERKTITLTGDTSGTWATNNTEGMEIKWDLGSGSNFNVSSANQWLGEDKLKVSGTVNLVATNAATLEFTGVQLEVGSVATDFEHRSFAQELALCERYCETILQGETDGAYIANSVAYTTNQMYAIIRFRTPKRATNPTLYQTTGTDYYRMFRDGNNVTATGFTGTSWPNKYATGIYNSMTITAGQAGLLGSDNSNAIILITSEL
jgi:hypothetical protein